MLVNIARNVILSETSNVLLFSSFVRQPEKLLFTKNDETRLQIFLHLLKLDGYFKIEGNVYLDLILVSEKTSCVFEVTSLRLFNSNIRAYCKSE